MAAKAEKDPKTGKWYIQYRYTDYQGQRKKSTKRGFETKREAEEWLRNFLVKQQKDFNLRFEDFLALYYEDMETRLREHTLRTKKYIIDLKILPTFAKKKMSEISAADVRKWQNDLLSKGYTQTYCRTINNQLSAIFNFAVKYYDLPSNPCKKAGSIGRSRADEMQFWTQEEFEKFLDSLMDKHQSYAAFMTLFWTGMRVGELLALTLEDIDFENGVINVSKSYQRIDRRDVITEPKTPKSKRKIVMPEFLAVDLQDYINHLYAPEKSDRLFPVTKSYLEHEMKKGVADSGVKRIRLHDLRHSHVSLLIEMGVQPLEIAERLGHERIETTLSVYAHLYPNKQQQLASKLDEKYKESFQ